MPSRVLPARFNRKLLAAATVALVGATIAIPQSAYAWWGGPRFGIGISVPLVVPAPPAYYPPPAYTYYAPPPPVYYRPPPRVWIPPHRNWAGAWVPGHWVWR
ncbi:hypothetical protein AruPA_07765 [Acidiphilium sp. PA]|uniref:hypothetical protein n=1 Tax=Acidiphilium sp. PA TaxID=2871705 RepID=UPI002243BD06|nr:hypothetical protein [Acidiphilium sp. PA]MCW8306930.1 hypothetical protein [Acidiphilium sp. PA]